MLETFLVFLKFWIKLRWIIYVEKKFFRETKSSTLYWRKTVLCDKMYQKLYNNSVDIEPAGGRFGPF